jgi:hypothetical protein
LSRRAAQITEHIFCRTCRAASRRTSGGRTVEAYNRWWADRVIIEKNQGGDLCEQVLRSVDKNLSITRVHAKQGKRVCAAPVAALYEQGKVSHIGGFAELEDQLTSFAIGLAGKPQSARCCGLRAIELNGDHLGRPRFDVPIPYIAERPRNLGPGLPPVIADPQQFQNPAVASGPEYGGGDCLTAWWPGKV